jgi:tetratricopeptide (TPR) repeat protein
MPEREYLITATKGGQSHTEYIRAESARAAVLEAEHKGLTGVKLITSDVSARVPAGPEQRAERRTMPAWMAARLHAAGPLETYLLSIVSAYRRLWFIPVIAVIIVAVHLALGYPPGWVEAVAILIAAIPFALVVLANLFSPSTSNDINDAILTGDWPRLIELIDRIEQVVTGNPGLEVELTKWRARALAATGRLDEAEQRIADLGAIQNLGEPMQLFLLGTVYESAHHYKDAGASYQSAVELDPDFSDAWLALALVRATRLRDAPGARTALDRAQSLPIAEPMKPIVDLTLGAIALEENQPALDHLRRAREAVHKREAVEPLLALVTAGIDAQLCLAYAARNDRGQAERHLELARTILEAHGDRGLIERCEEAINSCH